MPFAGVETLRAQVPYAKVVGNCECGCATIDVEVSADAPSAVAPRLVPVDVNVVDQDGEILGGVILFLKDGYLSLLEVYSFGEPIMSVPPTVHLEWVPPTGVKHRA